MDDIWWFVLVLVALVVGFALGFGAGRFGRVSLSRERWAEVDGELTTLRSDNATLRAEVARQEGELETARLFARGREAEAPAAGDSDAGPSIDPSGTSRIR